MISHKISETRTPIAVILRCSCGWHYSASRRQNARARAAKVKAAIRAHIPRKSEQVER